MIKAKKIPIALSICLSLTLLFLAFQNCSGLQPTKLQFASSENTLNHNTGNSDPLTFPQHDPIVSRRNTPFDIGTNIDGFNYWNSGLPFKDLMFQSGTMQILEPISPDSWQTKPCHEIPNFDNNGYPLYLPDGCHWKLWIAFHIPGEYWTGMPYQAYKSGHYALLYQGQGNIQLGWDAQNVKTLSPSRIEFDVPQPNSGLELKVLSTNPSDPIRDIHIVHQDDEASYLTQPFNEIWLNLHRPFKALRFMDWGRASENISIYNNWDYSKSSQAQLIDARHIKLPDDASDQENAYKDMVVVTHINSSWPRAWVKSYSASSKVLELASDITSETLSASTLTADPSQMRVTIYDFANRHWSERAGLSPILQQTKAGVAYEYMIQLCNTIQADPWISIPTGAEDDFIEGLAILLKEKLSPSLKAYIEYSNETWNYNYPGYHYSDSQVSKLNAEHMASHGGTPLFPPGLTWIPGDNFQAYRALQIFKIFNRVFGDADLRTERKNKSSRIVRVLTSQTAWVDRAQKVMDWKLPDTNAEPSLGHAAHEYADAWAIAPYFSISKQDKEAHKDNLNNYLRDASIDTLIETQMKSIDEMFQEPDGIIYRQAQLTHARGLPLVFYEGGTHLITPSNLPDQNASTPPGTITQLEITEKLVRMNRDVRMRLVYTHYLDSWFKLSQKLGPGSIGTWMQFADIGRYSKWGFWGLMESYSQNPQDAPKYQGIMDFISRY